jgi:hypothetical protein
MTMFGQNYGDWQPSNATGNVSLGTWHGYTTINPFTRFYINTATQNAAEFRTTGNNQHGLMITTFGDNSNGLSVNVSGNNSYAAALTGKTYLNGVVGIGIAPNTLAAHEQLAVRNGMITTSGTGNGISLNGSYYGSNNDFGTQRYGLFWGDPSSMKLSIDQTASYTPIVLSSFYGLGFDVSGGKMALCQNGALYIGSNNAATKTRIQNTADLAISALEYQLYVEKGIRTEKVKVNAKENWPDFVFEENYNLPSLTEVAVYIEENKHLPNVPSAAEVEQNGVDLGEMDKILLQKVEELTLYVIQQQKQIEALQSELKKSKQ